MQQMDLLGAGSYRVRVISDPTLPGGFVGVSCDPSIADPYPPPSDDAVEEDVSSEASSDGVQSSDTEVPEGNSTERSPALAAAKEVRLQCVDGSFSKLEMKCFRE